jgi:hypothetical protein
VNLEFHYYIIHFLATHAGFNENDAWIIAYSSALVDNNIISYKINTGKEIYPVIPTQDYGFWEKNYPVQVYLPFHFFPGDLDKSIRKDQKLNPLNCTPNSKNVKNLLIKGLKSRNLYRVGIALHTFADSWAHQNFSGTLEEWNMMDEISLIPSIGHAQAYKQPDDISGIWEDKRLSQPYSQVNNRKRFLVAAKKIYKYLCTYNKQSFQDWELIIALMEEIIGPPGKERSKKERILDFIIQGNIKEYNRLDWMKEAFNLGNGENNEDIFSGYSKVLWIKEQLLYRSMLVKKDPVSAKSQFYQSHFYKWHEATKEHRKDALQILKTKDLIKTFG